MRFFERDTAYYWIHMMLWAVRLNFGACGYTWNDMEYRWRDWGFADDELGESAYNTCFRNAKVVLALP